MNGLSYEYQKTPAGAAVSLKIEGNAAMITVAVTRLLNAVYLKLNPTDSFAFRATIEFFVKNRPDLLWAKEDRVTIDLKELKKQLEETE